MKPTADDPGSLSHLHDIVVLPPVSWWPPAPAWYVLALCLLIGCGLLIAWMILRWRLNWYRRAGLAELQQIEQTRSQESAALTDLAELLKRVALVAYPRQQVAALTGLEWLRFLDQTAGTTAFSAGPGRLLMDVYDCAPAQPPPELFQLVRLWIRRHRRDVAC